MTTTLTADGLANLRDEADFPDNFDAELLSNLVMWAWADDQKMNDYLEKNFPDWGSWSQGDWAKEIRNGVCQSAFCMAGQAAVQKGFRLELNFHEREEVYDNATGEWTETGRKIYGADSCTPVVKNGKDAKGRQKYKRTGATRSISETAQEALGLFPSEANRLFNGSNDIEDISYLAQAYAAVRGVEINLSDEVKALGRNHDTLSGISYLGNHAYTQIANNLDW